jgi:soluble lytic murein transglycosylase
LVEATGVAAPIPRLKPEAPVSSWVTPSDEGALRAVFEAVGRRNFAVADSLRQTVDEPIARALADWAYLRADPPGASAEEVGRFLEQNYGWPDATGMQTNVERTFTDSTPAATIRAFFEKRDPLTGEGHVQLARTFLEAGNVEAGREQLRRAWIDFNWSTTEERALLRRYGDYLTPADHWAKADRQLFDIRATATESILSLLSPERRREAEVRIAFLKNDRNAPALYNALPNKSAQDSGVLLAATRYHRRNDQEPQAILYAGLAPLDRDTLRDVDAWFYERKLLTRWALKTGRFEDAYTLSAYSGLEDGADFAEAEFTAGWVALRFLNDPERAKAHFAFMGTGVGSPISRSRAEYWLGRAYAAAGEIEAADQHYRVAAEFPYTYYGQLAVEELGDKAPLRTFPEPIVPDATSLTVFEARPMTHAMRILSEIGESTHFDRFARALDDQIESEGEVAAYNDLVLGEWKYYLAVRGGKVARNNGAEVPEVIYPLYPVPESAARFAEPSLILGLSRQESEFNPRAYSRARARGLMQMLSSTAQITARKENMPYSTARLMDDPNYNLTLGAAHLSHLLDRFNGSYIMVLAGYNAGPHRVTQWVETYGDPRSPDVDPIDWIELIPFSETRNYVMRVLENTQVYRARLEGVPLGTRLKEDLIRGGSSPAAIGVVPPAPKLLRVAFEDGGGPDVLSRPEQRPHAVERFERGDFPPINSVPNAGLGGESD